MKNPIKIKNILNSAKKLSSLFTKNKERGFTSIGELIATLSLATVVIGGVSVNAQDLLKEASDTQKVANLRQISTALELAYSDNQSYPQTDFDGLISELIANDYLVSSPSEKDKYDYSAFNDGENYVLRTTLANESSSYFENALNGTIEGVDCNKPYYCIKM